MRRPAALLLGMLFAAGGAAAGWDRYAAVFPGFPCADGWSACRTALGPVSAGTWRDARGRPMPADQRLGWFDLAAGPTLSPFAALSDYGVAATAVAVAGAPVADPAAPAPGTEAPVPTPAEALPAGEPAGEDGLVDAAVEPLPVSAPPAAGCPDLVALEPEAMSGSLSAEVRRCLEGRVQSEPLQTTRDKVSRVLLADAEARNDRAEWERLVRRHLEDIDRSDPDLCFKYAAWLARQGTGRAQSVIRWADVALENKHRWSGETYKSRVNSLLKLRAEAATKLWQAAETEYTTGEHTPENEARANKLRGQAKETAKDWLDYASSVGGDTRTAMALCVSAAGSTAWCEGG